MITFKKIQIVGFKSFADKTVIPLDDGVTCIVGPNGCGKSNVADAIRWVLGEQSAKMMRGTQMLDVIFNGTDKRRPMSFCEVTLTFDNTSRIFDMDCDEIEMTRRLYRDGESEYLLNRQPSRMKVLTSLLHGAGAAKEGYSIIGQGRIDQIMNSKPEDRRSIFEEATGIVVYKDRKNETERKLAVAKDNLYIHNQITAEKEKQIAPLEKEAENALKHREISAKLKEQETNLYIYRHDTTAEKLAVINGKADEIKVKLDETDALLAKEDSDYGDYRENRKRADEEYNEYTEKLRLYEVGMEHRSGESRLYGERVRALKDKLNAAQEEFTVASRRLSDVEKETRLLEQYIANNNSRIDGLKKNSEADTAALEKLNGRISEYDYMRGEQRKKVMDTIKDLSELRRNMGSLEAQNTLLKERVKELSSGREKCLVSRSALRAEYDESLARGEDLNSLLGNEDAVLEAAENRIEEQSERIRSITSQIYDTQAQISGLKENLSTYRGLRDRFDGYVYAVKNLLNEARRDSWVSDRIDALIADVVTTPKQYEVAIETAFGGAMQDIITRTREDARDLILLLKRNRLGQVTFLPIDAVAPRTESAQIKSAVRDTGAVGFAVDLVKYERKYENIIRNLLGNTLVCEDIQSATAISARYPRAFKIVTLDGDLISATGSMTGGSKKENSANLLASERRIKETEESINSKTESLERLRKKLTESQESLKTAEIERQELNDKLQAARIELAGISEKQSALLKNISSAESEIAAYNQSIAELDERLKSLNSEYSGVTRGESDLHALSESASSEIEGISEEYEKLCAERDLLNEKIHKEAVDIASLNASTQGHTENVKRLNEEKTTLVRRIQTANENIPAISAELQEFTRQAQMSALTEEERKTVEELEAKTKQLRDYRQSLDDKIMQSDARRREIQKEKEQLTYALGSLSVEAQKLTSSLENLEQRITEVYNENYEGCLKYKIDNFSPEEAPRLIDSYRAQIKSMGFINQNAVEQLEELKKDYEKKLAEKEDMEKAIADLKIALDDIRAQMLNQFDEGFNIIGENFKRTFRELFGGGRAELQLDYSETDDPLEAGVEITACPPGKKLTKISLLSGGERALTAIAILFAIIGMRPMPFCVLDEIEAALDEANVGRYARYLKKFSSNTQFIVITHRKPTMENADVLFGVTMEEKGVSKIVSVKLSEVESKLGGDTVSD